jgi:hypothetical protein
MILKKQAITVRLPAPHGTEIKCPICDGNKCKVCEFAGKLKINVSPKVPIQRAHIVKYVAENIHDFASEITRLYGLIPEVNTLEVFVLESGQYEVVQISSLGGACWVVNRLDELEAPQYFTSRKELKKFKEGLMIE